MTVSVLGNADQYLWKKLLKVLAGLARLFSLTVKVSDGDKLYRFRPKSRNDIFRYTTFFTKEEGTLAWIRNNVREGTVMFDIGANVGLYSLYAARCAGKVQVYSFEPHKINFATLVENVSLNGLEGSVNPVSIPLGNASGTSHMNYNSTESGTSMSQLGHAMLPDEREFKPKLKELVYALSLDDLMATGSLPAPDMIKVDVDGNEIQILEGMKRLLASEKCPTSFQVEINTGRRKEVMAIMEGCGYRLDHCHLTKGGVAQFEQTKSYDAVPHNAVFVKERARA